MNRPISLKDACREAGVSLSEMRKHADGNDLYLEYTSVTQSLDEGKFLRWLDAHHAATSAARQADKEREYAAWVEANGDFLSRFLRENVA